MLHGDSDVEFRCNVVSLKCVRVVVFDCIETLSYTKVPLVCRAQEISVIPIPDAKRDSSWLISTFRCFHNRKRSVFTRDFVDHNWYLPKGTLFFRAGRRDE